MLTGCIRPFFYLSLSVEAALIRADREADRADTCGQRKPPLICADREKTRAYSADRETNCADTCGQRETDRGDTCGQRDNPRC
jgi:hypothetical protein